MLTPPTPRKGGGGRRTLNKKLGGWGFMVYSGIPIQTYHRYKFISIQIYIVYSEK